VPRGFLEDFSSHSGIFAWGARELQVESLLVGLWGKEAAAGDALSVEGSSFLFTREIPEGLIVDFEVPKGKDLKVLSIAGLPRAISSDFG
jgi:hypothetical protein